MRFQIPQFIEVEDKLFGPLTLKQFIYLAGGAGLSVVLFLFLPLIISVLFILPLIGISIALAFYKVNNKPFVNFLQSAFEYSLHPKLYIWQQQQKEMKPETEKSGISPNEMFAPFIPKLSDSKLKDLTWTLDTKDGVSPTPTKNERE